MTPTSEKTDPAGYDPVTRAALVNLEARLAEALERETPSEVTRRFLAENNALIRQPDLETAG